MQTFFRRFRGRPTQSKIPPHLKIKIPTSAKFGEKRGTPHSFLHFSNSLDFELRLRRCGE